MKINKFFTKINKFFHKKIDEKKNYMFKETRLKNWISDENQIQRHLWYKNWYKNWYKRNFKDNTILLQDFKEKKICASTLDAVKST